MKRLLTSAVLFALAMPVFAKPHHEVMDVPCNQLWAAVKDTLQNSGKYSVIELDDTAMRTSYKIERMGGKRTNSVMLTNQGDKCEVQIDSTFSGLAHNDAADFKKHVEESLAKLKAAPAQPTPQDAAKQPAPAQGSTKPSETSSAPTATPPNVPTLPEAGPAL